MSNNDYRPQGAFGALPNVVKNLLIINVLLFLLTLYYQSRGIDLTDLFGLHYFESSKFSVFQIVSYMFMHDPSGFMHIGFNMLGLFIFGGAVENTLGPKKFLTLYLLTGFGAAITHYAIVYYQLSPTIAFFNDYLDNTSIEKLSALIHSDAYGSRFKPEFFTTLQSDPSAALIQSIDYVSIFKEELLNAPVLIGASGAVYGVLVGYLMLFPNNTIYLFFALPIKAKYAIVIFGFLSLNAGIRGGDNVAHFAHLGGLVTGIIIVLLWRRNKGRRQDNFFDQN